MKPLRCILFGGSFDPIHEGHLALAQAAYSHVDAHRVFFIPCKQSPHKTNTPYASDAHRFAMCVLATQSIPWASVCDWELSAPPPSYSIKTAHYFQTRYPHAELFWLMGGDQWKVVEQWKDSNLLAKLLSFVVFTRHEEQALPRNGYTLHTIQSTHPASSSAIRNTLLNQPSACIKKWLPKDVMTHIKKHNLYMP